MQKGEGIQITRCDMSKSDGNVLIAQSEEQQMIVDAFNNNLND